MLNQKWLEDLAVVVELATMIEDRDRSESAALLRMAHWVDRKRNAPVTGYFRWERIEMPHIPSSDLKQCLRLIPPMARVADGHEISALALTLGCQKKDCKICDAVRDYREKGYKL